MTDIAGNSLTELPVFGDLRYRLFSAVAGTLAAANRDQTTAFIVREFATSLTTPEKRKANKIALEQFRGRHVRGPSPLVGTGGCSARSSFPRSVGRGPLCSSGI